MEHLCPHCFEVFLTHSSKANHIRWKHVQPGYTSEGLQKIRESAKKTNAIRALRGQWKTEIRICRCGASYEATFKTNRKYKGKISCSYTCGHKHIRSQESKSKTGASVKKWIAEHPEQHQLNQQKSIDSNEKHNRFSSKAERALAEKLKLLGFSRGRVIISSPVNFAVDIMSLDKKIWIESDGEWHFRQVHKNHDFEKTVLRDQTEEREALGRGVLLIRVDNQKFSLDEQLRFIWDSVVSWDGTPLVKKLYQS